jgi:hypothetical protein
VLLILLVGYIIAKIPDKLISKGLHKARVDDRLTRNSGGRFVEKLSPGGQPSRRPASRLQLRRVRQPGPMAVLDGRQQLLQDLPGQIRLKDGHSRPGLVDRADHRRRVGSGAQRIERDSYRFHGRT